MGFKVSATSPIIRIDEILKVDEKTTEALLGTSWETAQPPHFPS